MTSQISYLTVAELEEIVRRNFMPDSPQADWFNKLSPESREILCTQITEYIDGLLLVGCKVKPDQPLGFPRIKFGVISQITDTKLLLGAFKTLAQYAINSSTTAMALAGVRQYSVSGSSVTYSEEATKLMDINNMYKAFRSEFNDWVY